MNAFYSQNARSYICGEPKPVWLVFFPCHSCVKHSEETQTLTPALRVGRWRKCICIAPYREQSALIRRALFACAAASVRSVGLVALDDQCAVAGICIRIHAPLPLTCDISARAHILILFARGVNAVVVACRALREIRRFLPVSNTTEQFKGINASSSLLQNHGLRLWEGTTARNPGVAQGFLRWHPHLRIELQ